MYTVLPSPLDLTHHIWCLGIITDPVPEVEAFLEAPVTEEYRWGLVDPEVAPEDGEPVMEIE